MSLYDSDGGQVQCEFCYNKTYVSAEQREQDWAHHAAQCNTIVAATADTDLGMVPGAYESTAPARAWKSQDKPLPNYMLQHREPNGAVVQTVVHAPLPVGAPAAGGAPPGQGAGAQSAKIPSHTYTLSVALNGNEVHERTAAAPHGLIHAHAGDEASLELAKTRVASNGTTYWTPVASAAEGGRDGTFALRDGAHVSLSFSTGAGGASGKGALVQIEGTIPPNLDAHYARHLASLGTGLRGHLDQQLQAKGLPSAKRGTVAVVRGADPATGATATIAVHMDSKTGMATLADVEVHVPHADAQAPMALQRETFNAHQVDLQDAATVGALVKVLEEYSGHLERHVESLNRIEADADTIEKRACELQECNHHLNALAEYHESPSKPAVAPAQVRTAIKFVTQDMPMADHVGAKSLFSFTTRETENDFLAKFVRARTMVEMQNISKMVQATGGSMQALAEQIRQARVDRENQTGKFKTAFSGKLKLGTLISDFNNKKEEMQKWFKAAASYSASYLANRCNTTINPDNVTWPTFLSIKEDTQTFMDISI